MEVCQTDQRHMVYLTHRPALLAYARVVAGSAAEAEVLVQEAFLRFSKVHAEQAVSPRAYLFRIIKNLALSLRKRRNYEERQASVNAPFWLKPQPVETPEQQTLFCDQVKRLARTLSGMSDETRVIVEMYRFDGLTLQEIASHLGLSVATVHRQLRAAMARLAAEMHGDGV